MLNSYRIENEMPGAKQPPGNYVRIKQFTLLFSITQRLFLILEPGGSPDEQIIPCLSDLFPMAVVMILLPEQTRHGITDFVPVIIIVVFSAEQAGHGIPNLISFGIVKVRAAEESGMAFSDLLTMLVPVDRVAKQSFVACDFLCHDRTSLVGWK